MVMLGFATRRAVVWVSRGLGRRDRRPQD
jgi:hypothetical protein